MKRTIRLKESEMISLLEKIITESSKKNTKKSTKKSVIPMKKIKLGKDLK